MIAHTHTHIEIEGYRYGEEKCIFVDQREYTYGDVMDGGYWKVNARCMPYRRIENICVYMNGLTELASIASYLVSILVQNHRSG